MSFHVKPGNRNMERWRSRSVFRPILQLPEGGVDGCACKCSGCQAGLDDKSKGESAKGSKVPKYLEKVG